MAYNRYLYERENYVVAKAMVEAALNEFVDKVSLAYASAVDLSGLIDLDMNQPNDALKPFTQALEIRKEISGSERDPLVASSLNNLALAYTELGELEKAHGLHKEAISIRLEGNSDRIGNSYSNMSSLLLRMGQPDAAEEMLRRCPSLQQYFTGAAADESKFLETCENPRFSGDMVLLSRIRLQQTSIQDRLSRALRLASRALSFRKEVLGNGLKTCDSLYDVATIVALQGNSASSM